LEEKFTAQSPGAASSTGFPNVPGEAVRQPIKSQVDHRSGVKRQQLAEDKAADDGDAEGTA